MYRVLGGVYGGSVQNESGNMRAYTRLYTLYTRETLFMALACAHIPAMAL